MYRKNSILGLITARGGSKGLPKKNVRSLQGKPLIAWSIEEALKSRYLDSVVVSTENEEIAEISERFGAKVPFKRPDKLAEDDASNIDVVIHALEFYENTKLLPDSVMLLQPTSPLRSKDDIDKAIELFYEKGADTLVSVHRMIEHPFECVKLEKDGWSYLAKPPSGVTRRQEYGEEFFYINGAIYIAKSEIVLKHRAFIVEGKTAFYEMHRARGIDIDDLYDFRRAEFYLQYRDDFKA